MMSQALQKLHSILQNNNAISLSNFIRFCLTDKDHGYYINKNPFAREYEIGSSDFITSPEISQTFGEMIGLWLYSFILQNLHKNITIIELGGGQGTLMQDVLRTLTTLQIKNKQSFLKNTSIKMLEINKKLKELQISKLNAYESSVGSVMWFTSLDLLIEKTNSSVKNASKELILVISNEFFDAIPTEQYVYKNEYWHEIFIKLNENTNLLEIFLDKKKQVINLPTINKVNFKNINKTNIVYEKSTQSILIMQQLCTLLTKYSGAILTIDYGYKESNFKSSLRGFLQNKILEMHEVLNNPTESDITYNVNFAELIKIAEEFSFTINYSTQGDFLTMLGIQERAKILSSTLPIVEQNIFLNSINTLISNEKMGDKFKVLVVNNL